MCHLKALLDGPVADPLVSGDHDKIEGCDYRKPFVVKRSPRDLRKLDMSGVDDIVVDLAEGFAECQVVLVDEERCGHRTLRDQRPELFLISHSRADQFWRDLIAVRDLFDGLVSIEELPEPLGSYTIYGWASEAHEGIDHHG